MLHCCPPDGSLFCPAAGKWSLIPLSPSLRCLFRSNAPLYFVRVERKERGGTKKPRAVCRLRESYEIFSASLTCIAGTESVCQHEIHQT